jgi:hypothetical protein
MKDPWTQDHVVPSGFPLQYLPAPGTPFGVGQNTVFASEFGATSMSSFEAMSAMLAPRSWSLHGGDLPADCAPVAGNAFEFVCSGPNAMAQRNWACDNLIWGYFGPGLLNASAGEAAFKGQLFQCAIASALNLQQNIESRRAQNQAGMLLWQLNEIWPTGGWGTLEYGSGLGALPGGRWKPAHYWLRSHLFADVMAACGFVGRSSTDFVCFVSNERPGAGFEGTLALTEVDLQGGGERAWATLPVAVAPGPLALAWLAPPRNATLPNASSTLLVATLLDAGGAAIGESIVHLTAPANLRAARAVVSAAVAPAPNADGSIGITLIASDVALFVTLTCAAPGRFSDNAFLMRGAASGAPPLQIAWLPFLAGSDADANLALLKATLRVEHHAMYAADSA